MNVEGVAFEKLIRKLHQECSRKGKGDFELSSLQLGYWNRSKDPSRHVEIDLVALDDSNKRVRFGSCKRSADAQPISLLPDLRAMSRAFSPLKTTST